MHIYMTAIAGIALLIGGIFIMRFGLKKLLWNRLQNLLGTLTVTPLRGVLFGTLAAAIMQSSTAVSLITIGLVSAEYMTFYQGIGIILGANIGTCTTVQLMAVSVPESYLPPLMVAAFIIAAVSKKYRHLALALLGLFSMFTGISILSQAASGLSQYTSTIEYIAKAKENPLYGIISGITLTLLTQSSSAATGLLMSLADEGLIDLTTATYVVYGNNIGSCLSSIVIAVLAPLAARRVAVSHILLNVLGTAVALPFTHQLISISAVVSSDFSEQIAWVHTIFNITSSLIVLPFIKYYVRLVIHLTPGRR